VSGTGSPGTALGDIIVGVMSVRERLSVPALRAPGSLYASQRRIFLLSTSAFHF
jgi:hypothetical protein